MTINLAMSLCLGSQTAGSDTPIGFTVSLTGLSLGEARPGNHAAIGFTTTPPGGAISQKWGAAPGGSEYGTGPAPTDFTAGDDGTLYLEVTRDGEIGMASAPIRYAAPVNTGAPVVSGTATLGAVLSVVNGTWTAEGGAFVYQWQRNGADIAGAVGATYTVALADDAAVLRCVVRYTNSGGSVVANSNSVTASDFAAPVLSGVPSISGSAIVGQTLVAVPATVTGNPVPARTWQWRRDGNAIPGATGPSYLLAVADEGASVTVVQTETNASGSASAESAAAGPVTHAAPVASGTIADLNLTFQGPVVVAASDVAAFFTGSDLSYSVSGYAGAALVGTRLDVTPSVATGGAVVTVTAQNSGGSATRTLTVIAEPLAFAAGPALAGSGKIGATHTATATANRPGATVEAQFLSDGIEVQARSTDLTYVPGVGDDLKDLTATLFLSVDGVTVSQTSPAVGITHVAPVAAGGLADQTYAAGGPITALDVAADFTGMAVGYALAPASAPLPAGLSLAANGLVDGTPTTGGGPFTIVIRGSNSGGFADSGFSLTVTATGDTTPPEITNLTAGAQDGSSQPIMFDISEPATVNWVLTSSATQPTPTQITAGQDHSGAAAAATGNFGTSGSGSADTPLPDGLNGDFHLHLSPVDTAGNRSANVDSVGPLAINTLPTGGIPTLLGSSSAGTDNQPDIVLANPANGAGDLLLYLVFGVGAQAVATPAGLTPAGTLPGLDPFSGDVQIFRRISTGAEPPSVTFTGAYSARSGIALSVGAPGGTEVLGAPQAAYGNTVTALALTAQANSLILDIFAGAGPITKTGTVENVTGGTGNRGLAVVARAGVTGGPSGNQTATITNTANVGAQLEVRA